MSAPEFFRIHTRDETLAADRIRVDGAASCLLLHGAGSSERQRWLPLREKLAHYGVGSVAFDFSGHGESSNRCARSLAKRLAEARAALPYLTENAPRAVIGVSMSGEIAIRLACESLRATDHLITLVGAAYDAAAFEVPFGPDFTAILRTPDSWRNSAALKAIRTWRGSVTVIRAEHDEVVPGEIGQAVAENSHAASRVELIDLPGEAHSVGQRLNADALFVERLARHLMRAMS